MSYRVLDGFPKPELGHYAVRSIAPEDIEAIRQWRNAQLSVLRQKKPISRRQQLHYYATEIWGDEHVPQPRQMLFVLTYAKKRCAYGGLTNIDWEARRAELSFLSPTRTAMDPEIYSQTFRTFLEIVVHGIAFKNLWFHRIWHETYNIPRLMAHCCTLATFGFELEGTLRDHVRVGDEYVDSLIYGFVRTP